MNGKMNPIPGIANSKKRTAWCQDPAGIRSQETWPWRTRKAEPIGERVGRVREAFDQILLKLHGHAADDALRRADDEELVVDRGGGILRVVEQVSDGEEQLPVRMVGPQKWQPLVDLDI